VVRCPRLRVLRLSFVHYWTDDVVRTIIEGLPSLTRIRVGGACDLLSDRMLYTLADSKIECVELMPSSSHSEFGIEHLRAALTADVVGGVRSLITAAAEIGAAGGFGEPAGLDRYALQSARTGKGRLYILPEDEPYRPSEHLKFELSW